MSEVKQIPTQTVINFLPDSELGLYTFYDEGLPNVLSVLIPNYVGIQESVSFIENELLISMKNYPEDIDFILNSNGDLIVIGDSSEIDNYSIDGNGDLIYTSP